MRENGNYGSKLGQIVDFVANNFAGFELLN